MNVGGKHMPKYIHYGHPKFEPEQVTELTMALKCKPDRGIWASRTDAPFGWKDWCTFENWSTHTLDTSFTFELNSDAKILEIHKESDIVPYIIPADLDFLEEYGEPTHCGNLTNLYDCLNLDLLYDQFDGIELFLSDDFSMHRGIFNTWDCDCIVVWNPDVIIPD